MKVIDEKGKIFGKINIIDLLVLLAIVFVGIMLGMKLVGGDKTLGGDIKLAYTVKVEGVEEAVYLSMQQMPMPDRLMAAGSLLNGQVTAMTAQPTTEQELRVTPNAYGTPEPVTLAAPNLYDLFFTVEAYVTNEVKRELGTQEIRLGKRHILKTQNFEFENGQIISCVQEKAPEQTPTP